MHVASLRCGGDAAASPAYGGGMLARLILVLLLALSATPMAAGAHCHATATSHHATPSPAPDTAVSAHVCIGCVAPADRLDAPAAPSDIGGGMPFRTDPAVLVRATGPMPPLPPPRGA